MKMVEQLEEKYSTVFRLGKIWTFFYQGEQHQLMGVLSKNPASIIDRIRSAWPG